MIASLKGILISKNQNDIGIDVNGVGNKSLYHYNSTF